MPFNGPIGAARVGYVDGQYVLNPTKTELLTSQLNLVVAGTEAAVLMVESEANELPEEVMLGAVVFGHQQQQAVIEQIHALVEEAGKPLWDWQPPAKDEAMVAQVTAVAEPLLREAYQLRQKQARQQRLKEVMIKIEADCVPADAAPGYANKVKDFIFELEGKIVRNQILAGEPRIDGRDTRTVRPITIRTGVLPRTHGSALFTRGETQALVVATLGTARDEQRIDALMGEYTDRFMLHYNMPPYATGETGRVGTPKRREIGHGRLAKRRCWRCCRPRKSFPYSMRVVSEITESNGSSSMASVCGGSLALMDAGVPTEGARRRHRDGPHQGRQPFRRADRHPGRRRSPGRHGLQGGRHRPRRHRAADGHQDPGHHQGNHGGCAVAGARRPDAHPALMQERCRMRAPRFRSTRRA